MSTTSPCNHNAAIPLRIRAGCDVSSRRPVAPAARCHARCPRAACDESCRNGPAEGDSACMRREIPGYPRPFTALGGTFKRNPDATGAKLVGAEGGTRTRAGGRPST